MPCRCLRLGLSFARVGLACATPHARYPGHPQLPPTAATAQAMNELQAMKAANAELTDENGKLLQEMLVGRTSEAAQLMATADRLSAARWSLDREIAVSPAASQARLDCSTPDAQLLEPAIHSNRCSGGSEVLRDRLT